MIQLEHLNLVVKDIQRALNFYQVAFPHWTIRGQGTGEWYGKPRTWLHFGDDYQYLTLNDNGEGQNRDLSGHQVGLAHFGIITQDLDAMVTRLQQAGFDYHSQSGDEPFRKSYYFMDPDGNEVEFVQYFSDNPTERNYYPQPA